MDEKPSSKRRRDDTSQPPLRPRGPGRFLLIIILLFGLLWLFYGEWDNHSEIDYSFFLQQLQADNIAKVVFRGQTVTGEFKEPPLVPKDPATSSEDSDGKPAKYRKEFKTTLSPLVGERLDELLQEKKVHTSAKSPTDYSNFLLIVWLAALVLVFFAVWFMIRRARDQMLGGGMLSGVTKSPARRYDDDDQRITFDDVAGLKGVKRDLQEIVEFLENPEKFHQMGAEVPKGILLMGPPGTGKTLLARAIAGEAGVPFFSINGSEFIQLFVGVGAGRVRDMFNTAKRAAPSILFIDEIDAVGRQRGAGLGGGHDEREQTLNQILSEMDGFSPTTSVIILAATNRPDVLDPALLRPGRFDRHITVDRPTIKGREELLKVHTRQMPLADDVELPRLARATVGMTGADIRNLANEAALWATRNNRSTVTMNDFEYARDRVLMGAEGDHVLTDAEKQVTACHEAGHTLAAWYTPGADPVHKVTIIPRGRALGITQLVPKEDRYNIREHEIRANLAMLLAGRIAENLTFGEYSAGAENDLREATRLARRMVTHWGMSERLGPVAYHTDEDHPFLGREIAHEHRLFSEHTAQLIDEEVARILREASLYVHSLLEKHRPDLQAIADALLRDEELDDHDIEAILGPSVNGTTEQNEQDSDRAITAAITRTCEQSSEYPTSDER